MYDLSRLWRLSARLPARAHLSPFRRPLPSMAHSTSTPPPETWLLTVKLGERGSYCSDTRCSVVSALLGRQLRTQRQAESETVIETFRDHSDSRRQTGTDRQSTAHRQTGTDRQNMGTGRQKQIVRARQQADRSRPSEHGTQADRSRPSEHGDRQTEADRQSTATDRQEQTVRALRQTGTDRQSTATGGQLVSLRAVWSLTWRETRGWARRCYDCLCPRSWRAQSSVRPAG